MNTLYDKTDCKRIKCIHRVKNGWCNYNGRLKKLDPLFSCRYPEKEEYCRKAGLKW